MAKRTLNLDTKDIKLIIDALALVKESSPQLTSLLRKMKNNMKTIKISSRKGKGRSFQKWVCKEISTLIQLPYVPDDDHCLIHSREMSQTGVDIILRGDALAKFPYSVECKNQEQLSLIDTIQQAQANTKEPYDWMIVHKRKILDEPIVMISWSAFRRLFLKST